MPLAAWQLCEGTKVQEEGDLPKATQTLASTTGNPGLGSPSLCHSLSGQEDSGEQRSQAALGAGRLPTMVQRPIWGSPSHSPWPASRKLQILG